MTNYVLWDPRIFNNPLAVNAVANRPNYFMSPDNATMPQILDTIRRIPATSNSDESILNIICHGIEMRGFGGYGLQLGVENLSVYNLQRFAQPLRNRFRALAIYGCQAANIAPGFDLESHDGDGKYFCSQLSRTLNCRVVAAAHTQYVQLTETGLFILDDWRGLVVTFEPNGTHSITRYDLYTLNRTY